MKTAERNSRIRWADMFSVCANGTAGRNRRCSSTWGWKQEKLQRWERYFLLTSLSIEQLTTPSGAETPHPNPTRGRLSQVHRLPVGSQRHRFIVLALQHFYRRRRPQVQPFEEFQKLGILLVYAENLAHLLGPQIREQHRTLFSKLRDSPAHRSAIRAALLVS